MNLATEEHVLLVEIEDLSQGNNIAIKDVFEMLAVFRQGSRNDQAVICKYEVRDENMLAESQPLYYFFSSRPVSAN